MPINAIPRGALELVCAAVSIKDETPAVLIYMPHLQISTGVEIDVTTDAPATNEVTGFDLNICTGELERRRWQPRYSKLSNIQELAWPSSDEKEFLVMAEHPDNSHDND
jgi:hypothetical protein